MNYLGPNLLRVSDELLGRYLTAGFELAEADHASKTVLGYVIGIAIQAAAKTMGRRKPDPVTE